jgi:hypothetical protein
MDRMQHEPADSENLTDVLAQRHQFREWRGVNRLVGNLFVWRLFLTGHELEGWQPERIRVIEVPGAPLLNRSIWRGTGRDRLLSFDLYECLSRAAAHDHLLNLLTQFQSIDINRETTGDLGDVAFLTKEQTVALYARANLVMLVSNAGSEVTPMYNVAAGFDQFIARRPTPGGAVVPEISAFGPSPPGRSLTAGEPIPLGVQAADPLGRPLWYAFWTRRGEVRRERNQVVYRTESVGTDEVELYAVNENSGVATATVTLSVAEGSE